ncbi:MAG: hypothetical protein WAO58_13760 [Fimbriimonadaceae bacterium]
MRLKIATTALFIAGVVLLIAWPWFVGEQPPAGASQRARAEYVLRMGLYFIATLLTFFTAAVCAFFVARRTRKELREEAMNNVKELIEGTLHDHKKKPAE